MPASIAALQDVLAGLPPADRTRFDRMYDFAASEARVLPPPAMEPWIANAFKYLASTPEGVLDAVRRQPITHVMNRATGQATLFNAVRSQRPIEAKAATDLEAEIEASRPKCSFCRPLDLTPANTFGRIGEKKTCANVAAYDGYHGLAIFEDHSPLRFRREDFRPEEVADLLATARAWAEKCHAEDPEARFFFLMWNCLWKAAASIIHGHAQMTVGRRFHYGKVERLRRDAEAYRQCMGASFFTDLVAIHEALGLAVRWGGVDALAHLTPAKEREMVLVADRYDDPDLPGAIWRALKVYAAQDVKSYNMAVYMPPLGPPDPAWRNFPVLVFFVDRGDLAAKTVDVGAMEFYASAVVSADPFALAEAMRRAGQCKVKTEK
ncbi:MAG: hypothetical protein FJ288_04200 [Planctomycetes bacterium]|nr:hypothetical protein [Planctomycetota bacterium]